jgi:hypothetical protein
MDVREKLVELIEKASYECDEGTRDLWDMRQVADDIADFLIANGVTAQEWISVKDRLPDRNDMVIAFYPTMRGTSGEMQIHKAWAMSDTCTHWMPLPQPPKGE